MIIGIDVGGTHADGVLLDGGQVKAKHKVGVDHDNLDVTIIKLLEALLPEDKETLKRIHLSTTLCTNALVNDRLDEVAMFIQAGPGTNPDFLKCGKHVYFLDGAIDHRGKVLRQPEKRQIKQAVDELSASDIKSVGVVTKFSHRNNEHEILLQEKLKETFPYISLGHSLSGMPNFPRRVYTTWLNSGLKSVFHNFRQGMQKGFEQLGINCPCYILKADGGTIPFDAGSVIPCQSIHSGPSASVMGAMALVENLGDTILLDVGGTTTDIGLFSDGVPLLEPYGATVAGRPTLIRALLTKSVGLGGDSRVLIQDGEIKIGPEKSGPPMAFGGSDPTPTDGMVLLGHIAEGSKEKAAEAMRLLDPEGDVRLTAEKLLKTFVAEIHRAVHDMIDEVFKRPVYTVSDFLEREKMVPSQLITIGGPAKPLQSFLEESFGMKCIVPEHFEVANAIGSGRARLTIQASLYGDTATGTLSIPEISCMEKTGRMFDMSVAQKRLREAVSTMALDMGQEVDSLPEIDFIEQLEMNTVKGFSTTGKIISLKAQIRPGLTEKEV